MLLLLLPCLIPALATHSIYLSDLDALKHLERLGFLSKYLNNDLVIEERSSDNQIFDRAMEPERIVFFLRSLIQRELMNSRTVISYLDDFGYLDGYVNLKTDVDKPAALTVMSTEDVEGALALFQYMNSMNPTGQVDNNVLAQMKIPRCGLPDIDPLAPSLVMYNKIGTVQDAQDLKKKLQLAIKTLEFDGDVFESVKEDDVFESVKEDNYVALNKRYKISDEGWKKNKLAFYIENFSETLDEHTYTEIISAFEVWTSKVELFLYEVKDKKTADIRIKFQNKDHGDKYPFDGAMGVLAHAFYPRSGEIHFDDDEEFTRFTSRGVNLRYTASHEFGHTLGLKHSMKKGAMMSPYHPGYSSDIFLDEDDLAGISKLFKLGKGAVYTVETNEAEEYQKFLSNQFDNSQDNKPHVSDSPCIDHIDAVIHDPNTKTLYFFVKDVYYKVERGRLGEIGVVEGYPKYISEGWDGLDSNIDAAYVNASISAAFFFKGDQYWKYDFLTNKMYSGFPSKTLSKVPEDLQATLMSGDTAYFFSKDQILKHVSTENTIQEFKNTEFADAEATFPLLVKGYFGATHGTTYSIYKVKNLEAVKVYHGRPLSWDYGMPMCVDDLLHYRTFNPKMKPFCDAYALLAFNDANLEIPSECYSLLRPFPAFPLEDIETPDSLNGFIY